MSRMGVWWWAVAVVRLRAPTEVHIGEGGPVGEKPRICLTSHKAAQEGALGLRWKSVKVLVMSQENAKSGSNIVQPMWSHRSPLQVVVILNLILWHSIGLIGTVLLLFNVHGSLKEKLWSQFWHCWQVHGVRILTTCSFVRPLANCGLPSQMATDLPSTLFVNL